MFLLGCEVKLKTTPLKSNMSLPKMTPRLGPEIPFPMPIIFGIYLSFQKVYIFKKWYKLGHVLFFIQEGSFCSSPSFQKPKAAPFFEEFSLFVSANIRCDAAIAVPDLAQIELVMFLRGTMGNKNFSVWSYSRKFKEGFRSVKWGRWFSDEEWLARWWFQIFFIFIPTCGNDPIWLIFFKWVETTNSLAFTTSSYKNLIWFVAVLIVFLTFGINLKGIIYT